MAGFPGATISSQNSGQKARLRLEFGTKVGKPQDSPALPEAPPPSYSLCHFGEVAGRGNDLPCNTGQRLHKKGCDLRRRENAGDTAGETLGGMLDASCRCWLSAGS